MMHGARTDGAAWLSELDSSAEWRACIWHWLAQQDRPGVNVFASSVPVNSRRFVEPSFLGNARL